MNAPALAETHDDAPAREQDDDQMERMHEEEVVQANADEMQNKLGLAFDQFINSVNKSATEVTEPALVAFHKKMLDELNAKVNTLRDLREQNHHLETKLYSFHQIASTFQQNICQTIDGAEEQPQDQAAADGGNAAEEAEMEPEAEPDTVASDDAGSVGVAAAEEEDAPTGDQNPTDVAARASVATLRDAAGKTAEAAAVAELPVDDGKRALDETADPSRSPEKPPHADAASEGEAAAADKSSLRKRQCRARAATTAK